MTVSEVTPAGKVVFVQKGWLRASHRALDADLSSTYRPYHPHDKEVTLPIGEPVEMSIEVFPFGHAFRAGSRLQLSIESPNVPPELWGFAYKPIPAVNTVHHEGSVLRLPVLEGAQAPTPLPGCGTLIRQSCR